MRTRDKQTATETSGADVLSSRKKRNKNNSEGVATTPSFTSDD